MDSPIYRIDVHDQFEPGMKSVTYRFLADQFERIKGAHPADQLLTVEQYESVLDGPTSFAILCHEHTGDLVGATIVTGDVEAVDWASEAFFDDRYATEVEAGPVFFIAALAVARRVPARCSTA